MDLDPTSEEPRGAHEGEGAPSPTGRAACLLGPSWLPRPTSFAYILPYTLKPSKTKIDWEFRRRKPL